MEKFHCLSNLLFDQIIDPLSVNFKKIRLIKNAAYKIV